MENVSFEKILAAMDDANEVTEFGWNNINIAVKRHLSLGEMMNMVNTVADSCFSETGTYHPEVKELVVRSCVMSMYANIDLPDDLNVRYDMICKANIVPEIMRYIDMDQFLDIVRAIDNRIQATLSAMNSANEIRARELMEATETLIETVRGVFEGIDNSTMKNIAAALPNMSTDEGALVKAVVDAMKAKEMSAKEDARE